MVRLRDLPGLLLKAEKTLNNMRGLVERSTGNLPIGKKKRKKKNPYSHAK